MRITFAAHQDDLIAFKALGILHAEGFKTLKLTGGQLAPENSVVLVGYSGVEAEFRNSNLRWQNDYVVVAADKVVKTDLIPYWAEESPFIVLIRDRKHNRCQPKPKLNKNGTPKFRPQRPSTDKHTLADVIIGIAHRYEKYFAGGAIGVPWGPECNSGVCQEWVDWKNTVYRMSTSWELTTKSKKDSNRVIQISVSDRIPLSELKVPLTSVSEG